MTSTTASQAQRRQFASLVWRLALHMRVLFARARLDKELAAGVDPDGAAMLQLRAAQLTRPRYRRHLAIALEERLMSALRGPRQPSSAVPVMRDQISDASETLLSLAHVLRSSERVHPRGVAIILRLLCDAGSPLYSQTTPGALERQARHALDCLVGQPWVSSELTNPLEPARRGSR